MFGNWIYKISPLYTPTIIAPNSRACKGGGERRVRKNLRRGMLTTGEWRNPVSNMLHNAYKGLTGQSAREVLE